MLPSVASDQGYYYTGLSLHVIFAMINLESSLNNLVHSFEQSISKDGKHHLSKITSRYVLQPKKFIIIIFYALEMK